MKSFRSQSEIIDHILEYDPEEPSMALSISSAQPSLMAPRTLPTIPWPKNLTPNPPSNVPGSVTASLPNADVLVVTWTVAEALALSDVLTPGFRSKTDWKQYRHNWAQHFKGLLKKGAPALKENCLGLWYMTKIGRKKIICFKSNLHFARDGAKLPVLELWKQLIQETNPKLVITTGTAGAIGANVQLGDVIFSRTVRFDCDRTFMNQSFNNKSYQSTAMINRNTTKKVALANNTLLDVTKDRLPDAKRPAKIITKSSATVPKDVVVSTDFFAYDNTTNTFGLQSLGAAVEMGDAVLGLACKQLGAKAPPWFAIRNASDPQIEGSLSPKEQVSKAGRIYEKYGYWTTVNSAIACWAAIAGL